MGPRREVRRRVPARPGQAATKRGRECTRGGHPSSCRSSLATLVRYRAPRTTHSSFCGQQESEPPAALDRVQVLCRQIESLICPRVLAQFITATKRCLLFDDVS